MHVVEGDRVAQALGQRRLALERHPVPPDVRELGRLERRHLAGQQAEPQSALVLRGGLEQQLHAEADAEHRRATARAFADHLVETLRPQPSHRLGKRPHAGDHDRVGRADLVVVGSAPDVGADVLERLLDGAAVAHPVVDERDGAHVSVPLVDGIPDSEGSTATATRSARANALKQASIMWWALVPAWSSRWSVSRAALATARKNSSAVSCSKPAMSPGGSC